MWDSFEGMRQIEELFKFKEQEVNGITIITGFLTPPADLSIWPYTMPCIAVTARMQAQVKDDPLAPSISISSYDDSGCGIWGTTAMTSEHLQKALNFLKGDYYRCPNQKDVEEWCKQNGFYADYW